MIPQKVGKTVNVPSSFNELPRALSASEEFLLGDNTLMNRQQLYKKPRLNLPPLSLHEIKEVNVSA